jgi:predicted nucleotidyltransferase
MLAANLSQLGEYLDSRTDVACAVVFGSAQDGHVKPGSDLDLALLFSNKPKGESYIRFLVEVADAADFDVIDLVDQAHADPILGFEAISGRFICKNDPARTAEMSSIISREYEAVMMLLSAA